MKKNATYEEDEQKLLMVPIAFERLSLTILIGKFYFVKPLKSFCYYGRNGQFVFVF